MTQSKAAMARPLNQEGRVQGAAWKPPTLKLGAGLYEKSSAEILGPDDGRE